MQITKPTFYKEFSCIAGACPDTCCAGWQIMIDEKSLQKYRRFKGSFRNRLHNDIDWKEHSYFLFTALMDTRDPYCHLLRISIQSRYQCGSLALPQECHCIQNLIPH